MLIVRNRSPYGAWGNFQFGVATLIDGLVRTLSFGFCHSNHSFTPLNVSKRLMKRHIEQVKKRKVAHE